MSLIDLHKWNLRKRHVRHRSRYLSKKSVMSSATANGHVTPSVASQVSKVHVQHRVTLAVVHPGLVDLLLMCSTLLLGQ